MLILSVIFHSRLAGPQLLTWTTTSVGKKKNTTNWKSEKQDCTRILPSSHSVVVSVSYITRGTFFSCLTRARVWGARKFKFSSAICVSFRELQEKKTTILQKNYGASEETLVRLGDTISRLTSPVRLAFAHLKRATCEARARESTLLSDLSIPVWKLREETKGLEFTFVEKTSALTWMKLLSPLNARSMNGPSMESLRSRRVFFLLPQQFRSLDIYTEGEALRTVSSTLVVTGTFCHTHTSRHSLYTKASTETWQ